MIQQHAGKKRDRHPLKILIQDFGWVHLSLGWLGNGAFFVGSVLFLPQFEAYKTVGVWLFIVGALLMWVGSTGQVLVNVWSRD